MQPKPMRYLAKKKQVDSTDYRTTDLTSESERNQTQFQASVALDGFQSWPYRFSLLHATTAASGWICQQDFFATASFDGRPLAAPYDLTGRPQGWFRFQSFGLVQVA